MAVKYIKESYSDEFPSWLVSAINKSKGIKDGLLKANIDLSNATYVPDTLAKGGRDPKLKDPSRVNVFKLMDGSVYLDGINNPYVYLPRMGITKNVSQMSWKQVLDIADEYGYIMKNDPDLMQKRADRKAAKAGSINRGPGQYHKQVFKYQSDPDNRWRTLEIPDGWKWVQAKGQDKSGYPLNPDKYKDMLDDVGLNNYADRLQKYYDKIENYRTQIIKMFNDSTMDMAMNGRKGDWGQTYLDSISDCVRRLDNAVRSYKQLNKAVQEAIKYSADDGRDVNRAIRHVFQFYASGLRNDLDRLKDEIAEIKNVKISDSEY